MITAPTPTSSSTTAPSSKPQLPAAVPANTVPAKPGLSPTAPATTTTAQPALKTTTLLSLVNQGIINKLTPVAALVSQVARATPQQLTVLQQSNPQPLNSANSHFLLRLNVQGQQLLAHSPTPFSPGQKVLLKLNSQQQLQISPAGKTAKPAPSASSSPSSSSKMLTGQQLDTVQAALRQVLPQQKSSGPALTQLLQLSRLPESTQKSLLSAPLRHTGQLLTKSLPSLTQLGQASSVKQAINSSGFNQESQIKGLPTAGRQGPSHEVNLNNLKTQLSRLSSQLLHQLKLGDSGADLDGPTVNLVKQLIGQSLPKSGSPPLPIPDELEQALDQLLKGKFGQRASNNNHSTVLNRLSEPQFQLLRTFLQRQLLQQSLGGLAKIQAQQLQGVRDQASSPSLLNRWVIELPFVEQQQVQTLEIDIQEHRQHRQREQADESAVKSLWQVKLCLELEQTGPLHAEIKLIGNSSEITLWFEQPQGLKKGQQFLQQLRNNIEQHGIELNGLQCLSGSPPQSGSLLRHNLINTKA